MVLISSSTSRSRMSSVIEGETKIYVNFNENVALWRYLESHIDDDTKEKEAPIFEDHEFDHQEILLEPIADPEPPIDVGQKRTRWIFDTLNDAEGHAAPR